MKSKKYLSFRVYCIIINVLNILLSVIIRFLAAKYWLEPATIYRNNNDAFIIENTLLLLKFLVILLFSSPLYFSVLFIPLYLIRKRSNSIWKDKSRDDTYNDFAILKKWYITASIITSIVTVLLGWSLLHFIFILFIIIPVYVFVYIYFIKFILNNTIKYYDSL